MTLITGFVEHLARLGLPHGLNVDDQVELHFAWQNLACRVIAVERGPLIVLAAPTIARVPSACMDETIRLTNALNATILTSGSFWVEPSAHFLGFELPILAPGGTSAEQVGLAIMTLTLIDVLYPAFARVWWAGISAEEAIVELRKAGSGQDGCDGSESLEV